MPFINGPTKKEFTPIPAKIVSAIAQTIAHTSVVEKTARNDYDKYNFATTDMVYDMLRKNMANAGLVILCLEKSCEIVVQQGQKGMRKKGIWEFQFVLACEDATWTDETCIRTQEHEINRPTAFMAAQSYAEKSFLRSLFKLPTGDKDDLENFVPDEPKKSNDAYMNEGQDVGIVSPHDVWGTGDEPILTAHGARKEGLDAVYKEVSEQIRAADSIPALDAVKDEYTPPLQRMPFDWQRTVAATFLSKQMELRQIELHSMNGVDL